MAYNLQPLITILEQILDPQGTPLFVFRNNNKSQVQSLLEKAASLQQILAKTRIEKSLERQIRDAANAAEDMIESHVVDRILSMPAFVSFSALTLDVQQAMQELDRVMEQVMKLVDLETQKMAMIDSSSSSEASVLSSNKSVVVGVEEDLMQLKDRLTATRRKLEIVPIVGMGGVGKTTLAQQLYQDPLIVSHFQDARAWATVSQDYDIRAILLSLLHCITGKETEEKHIEKGNSNESDKLSELKDMLYRSLYGRRYMIVLDDIWSTKFWDDIRRYFPDNNNGSRIVITTRESDVARYADSQCVQHEVQLLNQCESWNLLHQIVFGEENCFAPDLLEIGKKMASDCGGLPLAISVIGGLLSKVERSEDAWVKIGKNVRAAIAGSGEHKRFSNILSLSYNHLPNHLKPCFLYMGAFPEIKASTLVCMWVAEGLIVKSSSNGDEISLEDEAEVYLKSLVERNLVLVKDYKPNGKPLSYIMHDLLRDMCVSKAVEEKFLHVNKGRRGLKFSNPRRVSVDVSSRRRKDVFAHVESMSLARTFICFGDLWHGIPFPKLQLLRVLHVREMNFYTFPEETFQLVNLRYLAFSCTYLPVGISRLRNLQTLIATVDEMDEPSEIWQLSGLRHLEVHGFKLFQLANWYQATLYKKLRVISLVRLTPSLIEARLFLRIPNIKELGLFIDGYCIAVDLSHLHKLEILTCISKHLDDLSPGIRFPSSLRELSLVSCVISSSTLTTLCALPNLEVLNIQGCGFERDEWDMTEGFRSLQFLHLESSSLVHWEADETNLPRLRHLRVRGCLKLEEIPSAIGDIPTLALIELQGCSACVVASAKQILEVQQSDYDNYHLKLYIS